MPGVSHDLAMPVLGTRCGGFGWLRAAGERNSTFDSDISSVRVSVPSSLHPIYTATGAITGCFKTCITPRQFSGPLASVLRSDGAGRRAAHLRQPALRLRTAPSD